MYRVGCAYIYRFIRKAPLLPLQTSNTRQLNVLFSSHRLHTNALHILNGSLKPKMSPQRLRKHVSGLPLLRPV